MRYAIVLLLTLFSWVPAALAADDLSVTGRIVSDNGVALARARVSLHPLEADATRLEVTLAGTVATPAAGALSDSDGRFRLIAPEAGLWRVRVEAQGFAARVAVLRPLTESRELGRIELTPEAPLTVRVLDPDGTPLAGAAVYVASDRGRGFRGFQLDWAIPSRIGRSGVDGTVQLSAAEGERKRIVAVAAGRVATSKRGVLGNGTTLRLTAGAARTIHVTDEFGRSAAGLLVTLKDQPLPLGRTAEDGSFELALPDDGLEIALTAAGEPLWSGHIDRAAEPEADPFKIRLPERRTMVGRVIDAKTREPISGAIVWDQASETSAARTDPAGQFALSGPHAQRLTISAGALTYLPPEPFEYPLNGDGRPGPTLALQPAAKIAGRVIDAHGEGIAGAKVEVQPKVSGGMMRMRRGGPERSPEATTDSDGRFTIPAIDPDERYEIRATAEGFAAATQTLDELQPHRTLDDVRVTLESGQTLRGHVTSQSGEPLAGVEVVLSPTPQNREFGGAGFRLGDEFEPTTLKADSDREGAFAIGGVPVGIFDLKAARSGFAPTTVIAIEIEGTDGQEIDTVVLRPGEALEGFILDSDGLPVEGAQVTVMESSPMSSMVLGMASGDREDPDAVSDPNGWFAISDLAAETRYSVAASRPGFVTAQAEGLTVPRLEPLELKMQPASTIAGIVVDTSGEPIPGASVNMLRKRSVEAGGMAMQIAMAEDTQADGEGRFAFKDQEPGKVTLSALASGYQEAKIADLVVPKGEDLNDVRLELPSGSIVQGRVVSPDGRPAIGASVGKISSGRGFGAMMSQDAAVDGDGYYRLEGLAPGPISIEAKHPDYPRVVKDVELKPGVNALSLEFRGGQEVSGRIVDPAGDPIASATVRAITPGEYWGKNENLTASDGSFKLHGVQDGDYSLQVSAEGYAANDAQKISVEGQPVVGLEIALDAGARIVGLVSGIESQDFSRVTVRSSGREFDFHGASVDSEGRFRIDHVAPGTHEVVGTVADSAQRASATVQIDPGMLESQTELVFDAGVRLSGRVHQAGVAVAGATLSAVHKGESRTGWSQTDADGYFAIDGMTGGSYEITVREFQSGLAHTETVEVTTSREIEIEIPSAAVRGSVVDAADRQPLAGVQLLLVAQGDSPRGFMPLHSATSDSSGHFELPAIADGSWDLTIEKQGYAARQQAVEVRHGRTPEDLRVALEPTAGINLEVRTPLGGPADEVRLAVLSGGSTLVSGSYTTGENGSVRVSTVPPGQWELLITAAGSAVSTLRVTAPGPQIPVRLQPACQLTIEVPELADSNQFATLTLRGSDGQPYRSLGWSGQPQATWQMRSGRLEMQTLPPGNWTVQIDAGEGLSWSAQAVTRPGQPARLTLD